MAAIRERHRRPGRPPGGQRRANVRNALLEAARHLFANRSFNEVGTREIAAAAGVNPAMIHYYFGDKEGLYRAMLETVFQRIIPQVSALARSAVSAPELVEQFLGLYVTTLARDPWIPRLLIREVLSEDAPFRQEFVEKFASRTAGILPHLIEAEIAGKRLRHDMDPLLATISLMGMTVFPFLAHPILSRLFDLRIDQAFRRRFVAHTAKLFLDGARRRQA